MAIQYVDTNRQNTVFVPANKQDLINNIETVLLAAGWTTISGHNTTTLVMQSATTPQGLNMRIKVKDNAGTCVVVSLQNVGGTMVGNNSTTAGAQLNPGASTKHYRMVANAYQAFIWTPTPTPAREFAAWGVPSLPSFLNGVIYEAIWLISNSCSDTDTTIRRSWRTCLANAEPGVGNVSNQQFLVNGNLAEYDNSPNPATGLGNINLLTTGLATPDGICSYLWHDGSANLMDALVSWGLSTSVAPAIRGQLWDSFVASDAYTGDVATTADSHNWIVITDNNVGANSHLQRGSLFIATP